MLKQLLASQAERYPEKIAFACGTDTLTYGELAARSGRLARNLAAFGVSAQDCVSLLLPDGKEFVTALFALFGLRAIALPLAPSVSDSELLACFRNAAPRLLLTSDRRVSGCRQVLDELKSEAVLITTGTHPAADGSLTEMLGGPEAEQAEGDASSPAEIPFAGRALYLYTSGSEGAPKRICRRQSGLVQEGLNFTTSLNFGPDDSILCLVPLCHSYGLGDGLMAALCTGASLVVPSPRTVKAGRFDDAPPLGFGGRIASLISRYDIRVLLGVPYQYALLAKLPETTPDAWRGLKFCFSSGSFLSPEVFERFRSRSGLPIRSIYGSTEMGTVCVCRSLSVDPQAVGPPVNNVDLRILDDRGRRLPPETAGHIWVRSGVIPETGYDDEPDLNEELLQNGYFKSGDLGRLDASGNLTIVGRKEAFIESGGYKINSREIEEVVRSHPAVREAAVIGVDFPEAGEVVHAFIVSEKDLQESVLLEFCRSRMAFYKVPHRIEFCKNLPKSPLGKVLKKQLQREARQKRLQTDRRTSPDALSDPSSEKVSRQRLSQAAPEERRRMLSRYLSRNLADLLHCPVLLLKPDAVLENAGMNSMASVKLARQLSSDLGLALSPTFVWNYPTIGQMVSGLLAELNLPGEAEARKETESDSIVKKRKGDSLDALLDEIEALPER